MLPSLRSSILRCRECQYRPLRVFCNLSDAALQRFDELGMMVTLPGHAPLFHEGQPAGCIFVICTGHLKLSTTSRGGRTMIVRVAGPGDVLGLSATLGNLPYEITAESIEPARLKAVQRSDFLQFLKDYAEAGQNTAKALAHEYREVFLDARRLALSGSAAGRLAQLLIDWASSAACGQPELSFTLPLTHEELANMAGISRETVTRLLNQFERDQLIRRRGSSVSIIAPDRLGELVH